MLYFTFTSIFVVAEAELYMCLLAQNVLDNEQYDRGLNITLLL